MDKKNLSAARKKLEEYKLHKAGVGGGSVGKESGEGTTTFIQVNETIDPRSSSEAALPPPPSSPHPLPAPPPLESIPTFLNNLGHELQSIHGGGGGEHDDIKVLNVTPTPATTQFSDLNSTVVASHSTLLDGLSTNHNENDGSASMISPLYESNSLKYTETEHHHILTPTAPQQPLFDETQENYSSENDTAGQQNFPINFFQSTPISHDYQQMPSAYGQQDFYYNNQQQQQQPSAPLFYNVNGGSISPATHHQPSHYSSSASPPLPPPVSNSPPTLTENKVYDPEQQQFDTQHHQEGDSVSNFSFVNMDKYRSINQQESTYAMDNENTLVSHQHISVLNGTGENGNCDDNLSNFPKTVQFNLLPQNLSDEYDNARGELQRKSPSPPPPSLPSLLRNSSIDRNASQEEDVREVQAFQRMKSVQDALELQLEELRKDNERLLIRQSELIVELENNERNVQELRLERDRSKEEANKDVQPLRIKINSLYDENQRIMKNSNDVGMELRTKLQEKAKLYEDMENAFIIVSKSKMDLAAELDQEREKSKEMECQIMSKDNEIVELRSMVTKLEEKIKVEQQKDVIIHQLEDQIRHNQVQSDNLQRELRRSNNKIERLIQPTSAADPIVEDPSIPNSEHAHQHENHIHDGENCQDHNHDHSHVDEKEHNHQHLSHEHAEHHHHHEHSDLHEDHHHHEHENVSGENVFRPPNLDPAEEMKRRLHHLEWENSQFREDIDKLSVEARERRNFEEKFNKISEESQQYRTECQRLELVVMQLEGENQTIGDYITLYQSQRLALKESAKEKDLQLSLLAKERAALLRKMEELSELLKVLKQQKSEGNDATTPQQCSHQQSTTAVTSNSTNSTPNIGHDSEIEGRIRNLLSEISSSSLIENFHPCAVCSGQLMNV